jgi:acyl dehydratase
VSSFNDFDEGKIFEHALTKTITQSENISFCLATMNHHRLHLDHEYASSTQFGRPVVVGTLVLSIAVGITVDDISSGCLANLGYDKVRHHSPVFPGDTIRCNTIVLNCRKSVSKEKRSIVTVKTEVFNQKDELVLSFERSMIFEVE